MANYKIQWKRTAIKELKKLDKKVVIIILMEIEKLAVNPKSINSKKLIGSGNTYRLRVGDYRVVYELFHQELIIQIIRVGHRKDVYR